MSGLWEKVLNLFNYIGDHSGCHQIPERCFTVKGYTFPLCARCCGVLIGQLAAMIALPLGILPGIYWGIPLLAIMGIDWFIQFVHILESTNLRRFITGLCGGFGFFTIMLNAAFMLVKLMLRRF
ncbi:MAG: DUF2085 domain-containing protein [Clostridia bacterium]|nr:DUF2085 domain-containing protein [Clostridia bacterium]